MSITDRARKAADAALSAVADVSSAIAAFAMVARYSICTLDATQREIGRAHV